MAKIISFFNHKGGVGKTTTVHNLACALKAQGQRILLVDADPQMNLTAKVYGFSTDMEYSDGIGSTWRENSQKYTSLDKLFLSVLNEDTTNYTFYNQENEQKACIHLIPSSFNLSMIETSIVDIVMRQNILDNKRLYKIEKFFRQELKDRYDFILIDFSPSASSLINGLFMMMSDYFIVPSSPTMFCLQAIENLENVFNNWSTVLASQKQSATEHGLSFTPKFLGVIITMAKRRTLKGKIEPSSGTKGWMELVNERIANFYAYAYSTKKSISEKEFKAIFTKYMPFIIDLSYEFGIGLRTAAEEKGKSEYSLVESELPTMPKSKRQNEKGENIEVEQYKESLVLLQDNYNDIANSLIKLL